MSSDLLLENERVVDGTGAPWFRGSVAVEDGYGRSPDAGSTGSLRARRWTSTARYPRGIEHVLVGGEFVVRDGTVTGRTPGSAIRA